MVAPILIRYVCIAFWAWAAGLGAGAHAAAPITPSGLNTQVSPPIVIGSGSTPTTQYNITGGTRPGGASGTNLFHSFGDFNVPTNNIANFLNSGSVDLAGNPLAAGLATSNILGRVTAGNPSIIFGMIQTNGPGGFGNANLFLINPAGFLFGPNATMNVGGMVAFTTADYLRLSELDGSNAGIFHADAAKASVLTSAPVAAFGFLGSNPAAIAIQGSTLRVAQGQSLSLVGGNQGFIYTDPDTGLTAAAAVPGGVTVTGGKLLAPGGQIIVASVASPGEILASNLQLQANVDGASFTSLGSISLAQNALLDTSGTTNGTIMIRGGQLTIADGATITSAAISAPAPPAGSVTINGTGVQMTGSDIALNGTNVSVTGSTITATNLDGTGGTIAITAGSSAQPGNVTVSQGALLDASGDKGGTVSIRGKDLVINNATISADTGNTNGSPTAVDINVPGSLSINADTQPAITARTTGSGDAGGVSIVSGSLTATSSTTDFTLAMIDTHTSGTGKGGNVSITTGDLQATGNPLPFWFIDSGTQGAGNGGNVTITAKNITMHNTTISTGDNRANNLPVPPEVSGSGGNIQITAESLDLNAGVISTGSSGGTGGTLTLDVGDIQIRTGSFLEVTGLFGSGALTVNANKFAMDNGALIEADTLFGPGGRLTITANTVELTRGSAIRSHTGGNADAGDIVVTATDHITLADGPPSDRPSGFYSSAVAVEGVELGGNAGSVVLTTPKLVISGGARIDTSTQTSGRGGNVTIIARDSVSISGQSKIPIIEDDFDIAGTHASGIVSRSVGSALCTGPCGDGGHISITTGSLSLGSGAALDASTSSTGRGGDITIHAANTISLSGTQTDGTPSGFFSRTIGTDPGSGAGGTIELHASQFQVTNGAQISASTLGSGNAGNVILQGAASPAQSVLIDGSGSGVFTDTQGAGAGGNIFVNANTVTLQNGGTLSAATSGTAASAVGGSIAVMAPNSVTMTNGASITASSNGPANTGNIQINAGNQFAMSSSSVTTEASQSGGGLIKITTNPGGAVELTNSKVSASVLDGAGGGGSVNIDPQFVILQNSQILAQAVQGPGGNISITTNLLLADINSTISASSQFGQSGTITIQSPISPASGKILPLSNRPLLATSLTNQRCAALAGGNFSSFTVAGRDSLPAEPGGWLSSPLALSLSEPGHGTLTEAGAKVSRGEISGDTPLLSLRQIAPPGFLTQTFAVDSSAGCTS